MRASKLLSPPPSLGVTSQLCHSSVNWPNSALGRDGIRNPISQGVALANQHLRPLGHHGSRYSLILSGFPYHTQAPLSFLLCLISEHLNPLKCFLSSLPVPRPATVTIPTWLESKLTKLIWLKPVPTNGRWFPSESGSAQGFFLLSAREFFLATGGRFSVKQLCEKAPLLKAQYK